MERHEDDRALIERWATAMGIELGSTRIKVALISNLGRTLCTATQEWESHLEGELWSYRLDDAWSGIGACIADLRTQVRHRYGIEFTGAGAIGVSAMMHGYLAFDEQGNLLTPFRTWRNTNTGPAVRVLGRELGVNIPHRWSCAHFYQAVIDGEEHVGRVRSLTTLAGYVHRELTGRHVLGIGDASGMFPIDDGTRDYDRSKISVFDGLVARHGHKLSLRTLLPEVLTAGDEAGALSPSGAKLLDPDGIIQAGIPLCPPEGDAGTGMVATNSVAPRTGNISAGTSLFAMVVLDRPLQGITPAIDPVTTPAGDPVAMVHLNNGSADIDAWVGMFGSFLDAAKVDMSRDELFRILFSSALTGDPDAGGVVSYTTLAGEPVMELETANPLLLRTPGNQFTVSNLMRSHLNGTFAPLRIGMDILFNQGIELDRMLAHGGIFRTAGVAQTLLAAALETPISIDANAGEGGAWGMAVLAAYSVDEGNASLSEFLDRQIFTENSAVVVDPARADVEGFRRYLDEFRRHLPVVRATGHV